jgi:Ankyrin repeats (3 copies)
MWYLGSNILMEDRSMGVRHTQPAIPQGNMLRMFLAVLGLIAISGSIWCQTDGSAKFDQEAAKQAAKDRKKAVKEADKAIEKGDIEQLRSILQAYPDLVSTPMPQGVLTTVAVGAVASLVDPLHGAQLAYEAGYNSTLLQDAATFNRKDAAELLLAYHANVNGADGLGYTPLHDAVQWLSTDVVRVLLDHGADVNARAKNGDTPLKFLRWKWAGTKARSGQPYKDIEQMLLEHGAQ